MKIKWIVAGVGALAVLTGIGWALGRSGESRPGANNVAERPASPVVSVRLLTVSDTMTAQWLEVTGTVRAELDAAVGSKVMGRITSVDARQGQQVRRGQPLVRLDARDLDASIVQAGASVRSANANYDVAQVAVRMEVAASDARVATARAQLAQSDAMLKGARAKFDLAKAGPRGQERVQASLAVNQAKANLSLAESTLRRYNNLVNEGAIARQDYDQVKTQCDVAQAQYQTAVQSRSMMDEGSRGEDVRVAEEGVRQAEAAYAQARAGVRQAEASAMQVSVRRQEIRGAQAQIGQSEAALRITRVTRDNAVITAPFDGVITDRLVDPGAMANPGAPLLRVQGGQIRLEAVVPESELSAVRLKSIVSVRLDALRDREISGRVVEIAPRGDSASHTFIVKIALPSDSGARTGMFGRARFRIGSARRLQVPASAVTTREGLSYLYVVDAANIAHLRMVTVGDIQGNRLPVLSGLNDGERIVTDGLSGVADGVKVSYK